MLESIHKATEARMLDRVTITRENPGPGTLNATTFAVVKSGPTTVYEGKAMYGDRLSGHPRQEGFADKREHIGILRIPASCQDDVQVGDVVTFESGPLCDEVWEIVARQSQTYMATARFEMLRKPAEVMSS